MTLDIQARHLVLTDALKDYIKRRLSFALSHRFERIQSIIVTLSDVNGPRGGKDKRCQILISAPGMPDMMIDETQMQMSVAIDKAAARASRTLARRMSRLRLNATRRNTVPSHLPSIQQPFVSDSGEYR